VVSVFNTSAAACNCVGCEGCVAAWLTMRGRGEQATCEIRSGAAANPSSRLRNSAMAVSGSESMKLRVRHRAASPPSAVARVGVRAP
jgi:hypothetical protein